MELNKKYKIEFDYEYDTNNATINKKNLTYSNCFILKEDKNKNIIIEILNTYIFAEIIVIYELIKYKNEKCKKCKHFIFCLKMDKVIKNNIYILPYAINIKLNEIFPCDLNKEIIKEKQISSIKNVKLFE